MGADGNFNVTLNAPQINSENLDVTLTDAAGNVSAPGAVTAPDATAPLAPTDLAINEQGNTLTGRAEPGSTVSVRGAGGVLLGTAVAGADGQFSITLQPPQSDGQALRSAPQTRLAISRQLPASRRRTSTTQIPQPLNNRPTWPWPMASLSPDAVSLVLPCRCAMLPVT